MINVNNYQVSLNERDWDDLYQELGDNLEGLEFDTPQNKYYLIEMFNGKISLDHWGNEFNRRIASISINYGYMYTYFKKLEGWDIYQERDSEKMAYHFWFGYEVESLIYRLFTVVDNLYHLINIKYGLDVKENPGFRKNIMSKLKEKNVELFCYLERVIKDNRYIEAQGFRNDFTHNHPPLNMSSGYERKEGKIVISEGHYTKPEDALNYIDDFIELLRELSKEIKKHL